MCGDSYVQESIRKLMLECSSICLPSQDHFTQPFKFIIKVVSKITNYRSIAGNLPIVDSDLGSQLK